MIIVKKSKYPSLILNQGGERIQEVLGIQAGNVNSHSIAEITIPPGGAAMPHYHKLTEESYFLLSGAATLIIQGEKLSLAAGDTVLIEPGETHQIMNNDEEELVFIAVCVPAWQPDDSFEVKPKASK